MQLLHWPVFINFKIVFSLKTCKYSYFWGAHSESVVLFILAYQNFEITITRDIAFLVDYNRKITQCVQQA